MNPILARSFHDELQKLAYGEKEHVGLAGVATRGSGGSSKGVRGGNHIFITGLPGAGKTTLGKKKAKELGLPLISLDEVHVAGTADARRHIRELDTPHVIEGTQLLGFRKEDFKGHRVLLLEEPKSVLVDRLVRRGWNDSSGEFHRGEGARARTEAFHDGLAKALRDFKKQTRDA